MKILAIRGRNLASLAGAFEVDLQGPPLDRAGLIAITGPTGAGKTTLLDAMCLALFDKTPRYDGRGGVEIGNEGDVQRLKARDVRGILRRGAADGNAEVDFIGIDGGRYRARWEVWRARGHAEGKVQDQRMRLMDLTTGRTLFGERKTEVLHEIEVRLGLDFAQFRRSVLLAQGEFAAFLRAEPRDRAMLLESLTGTEVYRRISQAAHERARLEKEEARILEERLHEQPVLSEDMRRELMREATRAKDVSAGLEAKVRALGSASSWWRTRHRLHDQLHEAQTVLSEAEGAFEGAAQTREALGLVERLAPVRGLFVAAEQAAAALGQSSEELPRREAALHGATGAWEATRRERVAAEAAHEGAETMMGQTVPELRQARALDERLSRSRRDADEAVRDSEEATADAMACRSRLAELTTEVSAVRLEEQSARQWLESRHAIEVLAGQWDRVHRLLDRRTQLLGDIDQLGGRIRDGETKRSRHYARVESSEEALDRARRERRRAKRRLQSVERSLDRLPPAEDVRDRREAVERRLEGLRELHLLVEEHRRNAAEFERNRHEIDAFASARERARADAADQEVFAERTAAALKEARGGLQRLEAMRDLSEHRYDLEEGQACPLCGAQEHPFADANSVEEALSPVRQQRERVQALESELVGIREIASARAAEAVQHERTRERLETRQVELADVGRGLQERWSVSRERVASQAVAPLAGAGRRTHSGVLAEMSAAERDPDEADQLHLLGVPSERVTDLPQALTEPGTAPAVWALLDQDQIERASLRELQLQIDAHLGEQRVRSRDLGKWDEAHEGRRREWEEAREAAAGQDRLVAELRRAEHDWQKELEEQHAELEEAFRPFDDWRTCLATLGGLAEVRSDAHACIVEWHHKREAAARARTRLAELDPRQSELKTLADERGRKARRAARLAQKRGVQLDALLREREGVLGGRPVEEVEQRIESELLAKRVDLDRARAAEASAAARRASALTLVEEGRRRLEEARAAEALAAEDLAAALAQRSLDALEPDRLQTLLAHDDAWLEHTRGVLDGLRQRRESAKAIVGERRDRFAEHTRDSEPRWSLEEAERMLEELAVEVEDAASQAGDLEHRLRRDREAQARVAELRPQLDAQNERVGLWGRMAEVIGSSTGARFQAFAQSITLEVLLEQANDQLEQLMPRYSLQRVRGHDLELQLVDHDLGREVRSIRGLSGGESFMVSLALALGLASLSARTCTIESLFIDEGFGSLDPASFDLAIGTLDALQASGRQISIISHVPGLAERVGVEVHVAPRSSGRSRVEVRGVSASRLVDPS